MPDNFQSGYVPRVRLPSFSGFGAIPATTGGAPIAEQDMGGGSPEMFDPAVVSFLSGRSRQQMAGLYSHAMNEQELSPDEFVRRGGNDYGQYVRVRRFVQQHHQDILPIWEGLQQRQDAPPPTGYVSRPALDSDSWLRRITQPLLAAEVGRLFPSATSDDAPTPAQASAPTVWDYVAAGTRNTLKPIKEAAPYVAAGTRNTLKPVKRLFGY